MLAALIRRPWRLGAAVVVLLVGVVGTALVVSGGEAGGDDQLVVYNGRSHYGYEQPFEEFEERSGIDIETRPGSASELYERLRREGADTPADVLVTTDLANLWRAAEADLLQPATSPTLRDQVPEELHDPDDEWWALSTRVRTPVVATERVSPEAVTSYADLGDPRFEGRTCLRTSTSEYNQSLVADMLAKRGPGATRELLESWMANDPDIIPSDGEMLGAMAGGDCDVGLVNHYYLARILEDDPGFPVAPAWPNQDGAGAHANVSGVGVVEGTDQPEAALALMEWLTGTDAQEDIAFNGEFPANPEVTLPEPIDAWEGITQDPIAVTEAGPRLDEAIELMLDVGWR